jgi:metal-responsive CopG/Arc/MetJ family transcriptional regulator
MEKKEKKKKVRVYFSMDSELYDIFENHIDKNLLDQSKVIEKLVEDYIKTIVNT